MTRTTVDIDTLVLDEVKRLRDETGVSLGQVVSQLLAEALASHQEAPTSTSLQWTAKPMGIRVDLTDKDALHAILDEAKPR